ncbi:L,D-transpeptidase family protein [Streptomyces sp. NPDC058773]|uniref:L,D-transpeptidase family protein n=1 Tax=Streptomyces sp. NPDC058773 TaxID=3346632 RepID=UPI00369C32FB
MKRTLPALLACASLLVIAGPPAVAVAPSPVVAPAAVASPSRLPALVPGLPRAARETVRPRYTEYVPRSEVAPAGVRTPRCSAATGPYQRLAEDYLGRQVDGRQSTADCRAIRRFQQAHRIAPATGFAGPVTGATVRMMQARKDPNRAGHCPDLAQRTACVDLNRQLMWVQQSGRVLLDPVVIRSGAPTMETRTGSYRIYLRHRRHISNLYGTRMPYAQFFDRGEALHGVYEDLFSGAGSHGCVNLTMTDARRAWEVLSKGDTVYVWGRKPGV